MELIFAILATLFFLSQFAGWAKDNKRHHENQRALGIEDMPLVKADNAYSSCFATLCVVVFVVVMFMVLAGFAVGG